MPKKVGKMLKDLLDVGIDLVCFGVDTSSQDSIMTGEGKTANFVKEMSDLISKLYSFYEFESCTQEKDRDVKELCKLFQEHMNELCNQVTKKNKSHSLTKPWKMAAYQLMFLHSKLCQTMVSKSWALPYVLSKTSYIHLKLKFWQSKRKATTRFRWLHVYFW